MSFPTLEQRSLYAQDGVFLARNFLSAELLKKARACFDFVRDNPSPRVATAYRGTDQDHIVDDSHPESWDAGGCLCDGAWVVGRKQEWCVSFF